MSIPILLSKFNELYFINCSVNGYIAELVLPEPIVPVIKKFWYNPDSGKYIFLFVFSSAPISKFNLSDGNISSFCFLFTFLNFSDVF